MSLPTTLDRVPDHTAEDVNRRIRRETEQRVAALEGRQSDISRRLKQLDEEWDIERAIELNASTLALIGVALGFFLHPYWLALPAVVTAFLFQHALQGWCPPIPILRRFGFRTANEIEIERQALKVLRSDYVGVTTPDAAIVAAET